MCCENFVVWRGEGQADVRAVIPRRETLPDDRGVLLTAATIFKKKNAFYIFVQVRRLRVWSGRCLSGGGGRRRHAAHIQSGPERACVAVHAATRRLPPNLLLPVPPVVQSEYGDLYRVVLDYEGETVKGARGSAWGTAGPGLGVAGSVPHWAVLGHTRPHPGAPCLPARLPAELKVRYFDTIPTAASLCLMRHGFLFAASEFGDHALYQFAVGVWGVVSSDLACGRGPH